MYLYIYRSSKYSRNLSERFNKRSIYYKDDRERWSASKGVLFSTSGSFNGLMCITRLFCITRELHTYLGVGPSSHVRNRCRKDNTAGVIPGISFVTAMSLDARIFREGASEGLYENSVFVTLHCKESRCASPFWIFFFIVDPEKHVTQRKT